jgi:hypothetical protein
LAVRAPEPPALDPGYGEQVWQSIQGRLKPYPAKRKRNAISLPRLVFAAVCLVVLAAAFVGGRLWERLHVHQPEAGDSSQVKERVVLFILDDHLDRSERLLVQLEHAGAEREASDGTLRAEARQLLDDNRLCRQALSSSSDPSMTAALDHLERVLLEIANSPGKLSSGDIAKIEQEMNTDSLLFQIRVLRVKASPHQPKTGFSGKGASI